MPHRKAQYKVSIRLSRGCYLCHLLQFSPGKTEALLIQLRDIISVLHHGSVIGSSPVRTCLKHLSKRRTEGILARYLNYLS